ncbi:NfeD family protein [Solidesulfovibrio alcoholivorans]|uniref:NfeD family protein n=1 Tax=Solidesulfovibrio alcoholivorans TaxID=81406 RepID=UPI00069359FB|nr:nodulation protein NfeD [Solidesulfovibrio alcoholivorans]
MSWRLWLHLELLFCLLFTATVAQAASDKAASRDTSLTAITLSLDGAITPVAADFLDEGLLVADKQGAALVLVQLDTPGGSVEIMRRMVKSIRQSPVPVVLYVAPSGARAASAGVFLMAAAQINAMAPQTTIGSASPVGLGGEDMGKTINAKVQNDLTSLVRSLAEATGRDATWYQRAVTEAANMTAAEAVSRRVVDYLAVDRTDLLEQIGKRGLATDGAVLRFTPSQVRIVTQEPSWRHAFLSWLLNPQVAYILLLIGVAGVFFELSTPGVILPGVAGGLSLLLALYALSVLPTNAAGLLLLLFGGGLFLLEIHVTSYGLLSLSGLAALFFGSLLLFRGQGVDGLPLSLIAPTVIGVCVLLSLAVWLLAKAQRLRPRTGVSELVGKAAQVRHWSANSGKVFLHGEIWDAVLEPGTSAVTPQSGGTVRVVAIKDMLLVVTVDTDGRA